MQAPRTAIVETHSQSGSRNLKKVQEARIEGSIAVPAAGSAAAANHPRQTTAAMKGAIAAKAPAQTTSTPIASVITPQADVPETVSKGLPEKKRKRKVYSEDEGDNEEEEVPLASSKRSSKPDAKKKRTDSQEILDDEDDEPLAQSGKGKSHANQVDTSTKRNRTSKCVVYEEITDEEDEEVMAPSGKRKATHVERKKPQKDAPPTEESESEDYEGYHSDSSEVVELSSIDLQDLEGPCTYCVRRNQACVTENLATNRTCSFCKTQKRHCSLKDKRKEFFETKEGYQWLKANGHIAPVATKTKHNTTLTGKGKQKDPVIKVEKVAEKPSRRARATASSKPAAAATPRPAAEAKPRAGTSKSSRNAKPAAETSFAPPTSKAAAAAPRPKPRPVFKRGSKGESLEQGTDSVSIAYIPCEPG